MLHITVIAKSKSKEKNMKVGLQVKKEKEIAARGWMALWKDTLFNVADAHIYTY